MCSTAKNNERLANARQLVPARIIRLSLLMCIGIRVAFYYVPRPLNFVGDLANRPSLAAAKPAYTNNGCLRENKPQHACTGDHDTTAWTKPLCMLSGLVATSFLLFVSITPVLAESTATEPSATGFAEYAKKGGTMGVNPACFVTSCGKQTKECFVEDGRCLKGAMCLARCRGDPDCATQCFAEFGNPKLDNWLQCTVEKEQCVGVPEGTYDVSKFFATDVPTKLQDYDIKQLEGKWYKVRGYNKKYDCYPCQTNTFAYDEASRSMKTEVQLRLERKKSGGYWQNTLVEDMKVSTPTDRSTFVSKGKIFGLSFTEEWYVLGGDEDFVVVAYTGNNLQDAYKGAYVYSRTPEISPEAAAKAEAVASKHGYSWNNFCVIDNACPAQPPVDYTKSVSLSWDDLPDLLEWFAPGTTRGGTVKEAGFNGEYV